MSVVFLDKVAWEAGDPRDGDLMRVAMASVVLGEMALYDDGSGKIWEVYSSQMMTLNDMTFLGSTAFVLRGNSFDYDQMLRIAQCGVALNNQQFLWGDLQGEPAAPLIWPEDVVVGAGEDAFSRVMNENSKNNATIGAAVEIPGGWTPYPPPPPEE